MMFPQTSQQPDTCTSTGTSTDAVMLSCCFFFLTLLNKCSVNNPDCAVQRPRPYTIGRLTRCSVLVGRRAQSLQSVKKKDQHCHHQDGGSDAGPHSQVKGSEEREDVDLLLGFFQQDPDAVVQVPFTEVHHILPLRSDGDGRHSQVCFLQQTKAITVRRPLVTEAGYRSDSGVQVCPTLLMRSPIIPFQEPFGS